MPPEQPQAPRKILYRGSPALVSFLGLHVVLLCSAAALIEFSEPLSRLIATRVLVPLEVAGEPLWATMPYGKIFALPLALYGAYKVLWQMRARYEFTPTSATVETGVLWSQTGHCTTDELRTVEYRKGPFETLADSGELILTYRDGRRVVLAGVPDLSYVALELRRTVEGTPGATMAPVAPMAGGYVAPAGFAHAQGLATPKSGSFLGFLGLLACLVVLPIVLAAWLDLPILGKVIELCTQLLEGL